MRKWNVRERKKSDFLLKIISIRVSIWCFLLAFGVSLSLDQHTDSMDFIFILSYLLLFLLLLFMDCEPEAIPSIAFILCVRVCTTFARVRLLFDYWIFGLRISFHLSFFGISFHFFSIHNFACSKYLAMLHQPVCYFHHKCACWHFSQFSFNVM